MTEYPLELEEAHRLLSATMSQLADTVTENIRLRGLLARLEWSSHDPHGGFRGMCPVCAASEGDAHSPDCWLAAELDR